MSGRAVGLLLGLLGASGAEPDMAGLWERAMLWQVGENIEVVAEARDDLVAMGEETVGFIMARLGAETTLEKRALWAVVPRIGEPFFEPLMREAMERLVEWLTEGRMRLQVGQVYSLRDAAQAHRDLEGRRTTGKLVLKP